MTFRSMKTVFGVACFAVVTSALPITQNKDEIIYLKHFGYLEKSATQGTLSNRAHEMSNAITDFQIFAGLKATGELDDETIAKMHVPRCGVKDKVRHSKSSRQKRYALFGGKWDKKELTYRISKYPSGIKDKIRVKGVIARAFETWSNVTTLKFKEKSTEGKPDIDIRFESGDHGDGYPFDGPDGPDLAHASFPNKGGDVCFDDEENWTINEKSGTDLFQIAVHEFGHSLGLDHSNEKHAIMYALYDASVFQLHPDDIAGIQALYGSPQPSSDKSDEDTIESSGDGDVKDVQLFFDDVHVKDSQTFLDNDYNMYVTKKIKMGHINTKHK